MADKPKINDPSRRLPGFTSSYANHAICEFTKLDLTLVFAKIVKTETDSEIHICAEEHSSMTMSLGQAKILAITLAVNVANLEEQDSDVGTIKIPQDDACEIHIPDDMTPTSLSWKYWNTSHSPANQSNPPGKLPNRSELLFWLFRQIPEANGCLPFLQFFRLLFLPGSDQHRFVGPDVHVRLALPAIRGFVRHIHQRAESVFACQEGADSN